MPDAYLPAVPTFTEAELRALMLAAAKRAANPDDSQPYRAMWHEIAVLCAEELDRRRDLLGGMERDLAGLPPEPECGDILDGPFDIPPGWTAK